MKRFQITVSIILVICSQLACRLQRDANRPAAAEPDPWDSVRMAIDNSDYDEITIIIGDRDGNVFSYSKGESSPDSVYDLASASKWFSSATILRLVEADILSLENHPQDFIPWWTTDPNDARSQITLDQLLSFTSGFSVGPTLASCMGDSRTTLDACGQELYATHFEFPPGTNFYYTPAHLHIAALMAEYATGKDYNTLFQEQIAQPLELSSSGFFKPSLENPRAAGGGSSTANDYARFLHALLTEEILSASFEIMISDHTPTGTIALTSSPVSRYSYEWHYGFGLWRECLAATWQAECDEHIVVSSPGAFGWYPWIDVNNGYYGVIAVQERYRLFNIPSEKSVEFGISLRPLIEAALYQ